MIASRMCFTRAPCSGRDARGIYRPVASTRNTSVTYPTWMRPPPAAQSGPCVTQGQGGAMRMSRLMLGAGAAVAGIAAHDVTQKRHSVLRAFPVIGHARYFVEKLGPELRQYIVAGDN